MATIARDVLAETRDPLMNDEDKYFVNRHGKKMSLDGAALETPPPEEKFVPPTPQAEKPTEKPKKIRKKRNKKPMKKILLIFLVILLGLLLVPLVGGELVRARYISSRDGAKAQLVEYATKTVVPQQKKRVTLAQLSEAAKKVETIRDDACDGGLTDNLAMMYPRAKTAFDECIGFKLKIALLAVNLREMESQVRYLQSLAPALSTATKPTTDEYAVISAQLANWQTLNEELGKLSPAATQRATHDQLKLQTKAIVDAWSALNTANDNQDAEAFADAEKKLGEAYEAFRTSSSDLSALFNTTQTNITTSYKAL